MSSAVTDERLDLLLSGAKLDAQMQTSGRYKREAIEMVSILTELATRRAQSAVVGGDRIEQAYKAGFDFAMLTRGNE